MSKTRIQKMTQNPTWYEIVTFSGLMLPQDLKYAPQVQHTAASYACDSWPRVCHHPLTKLVVGWLVGWFGGLL